LIFSAPRFIVVDDKKEHLRAITETFERIGSPCLGVHFDPSVDLNDEHFRGVRCLFMDLHLIGGQAGSDDTQYFAHIASILEQTISPKGGPFVLIVWTSHPHQSDGLRDYLNRSVDPNKPYARPLAVLGLSKEKYINVETGAVTEALQLQKAIGDVVVSNPQLAALLSWEADVLQAAGDTLASLLALVPSDQRTTGAFPPALDRLLSILVREAVGPCHVGANPRAAISTALAPILSDRILNQDPLPNTEQIWNSAATLYADQSLGQASPEEGGEINRMLHLAMPGTEILKATDWGAVVKWPYGMSSECLEQYTGLTTKQMLCDEYRMRSSAIEKCTPVLVRVGAACDYAQSNRGPILFLFGLVIPESAERQMKGGQPVKLSDAIWRSPVFSIPGATDVYRLFVHIRFPLTSLRTHCEKWEVCFRLREQLLMHLISAASTHIARPGIVQLPVA